MVSSIIFGFSIGCFMVCLITPSMVL